MVAQLAVGSIVSLLFAIVGWVLAATCGGNYAVDFVAFQVRGYEATGMIGALVFSLFGAALSVWLIARRHERTLRFPRVLAGAAIGAVAATAIAWIIPNQLWIFIIPALGATVAAEGKRPSRS
jgi:hypothetical protein